MVDSLKEEYEGLKIDLDKTNDNITMLESKTADLQDKNLELVDEIDANEQYNQCNCLLLYRAPEPTDGLIKEDTDKAVIAVFQEKLKIHVDQADIDQSHRSNVKTLVTQLGKISLVL